MAGVTEMNIKWQIENAITDKEIGSCALWCDTEALISPKDNICMYCNLSVDGTSFCTCFNLGDVLK